MNVTTSTLSARTLLSTTQTAGGHMRKRTADIAAAVSQKEGDQIAGMVLKLYEHLAAIPTGSRTRREPTGLTYTAEMAPWVEQRSDARRR